jgi:general secretion pathway protein F
MLQANINISDALDILIKNKKDKNIIDFLKAIKYSFIKCKINRVKTWIILR